MMTIVIETDYSFSIPQHAHDRHIFLDEDGYMTLYCPGCEKIYWTEETSYLGRGPELNPTVPVQNETWHPLELVAMWLLVLVGLAAIVGSFYLMLS